MLILFVLVYYIFSVFNCYGCPVSFDVEKQSGDFSLAEVKKSTKTCKWIIQPGHAWSAIRLRFSVISLHDKTDLIEIWQIENGVEVLTDKWNNATKLRQTISGVGNVFIVKWEGISSEFGSFKAHFERFSASDWSGIREYGMRVFCQLRGPGTFTLYHQHFCYVLHRDKPLSYQAASDACGFYSHLAFVNDRATFQAINDAFLKHVGSIGPLIGLKRFNESTAMKHNQGWEWFKYRFRRYPAQHLHWCSLQPDNMDGNEFCSNLRFSIEYSSSGINDVACELDLPYLCEYESMCGCKPVLLTATDTRQSYSLYEHCPDMLCYHIIQTEDPKKRVKVRPTHLMFKDHDFLEVYDGSHNRTSKEYLLKGWYGETSEDVDEDIVVSPGNRVIIVFRRVQGYETWFWVHYKQVLASNEISHPTVSNGLKTVELQSLILNCKSDSKAPVIVVSFLLLIAIIACLTLIFLFKRKLKRIEGFERATLNIEADL